MNFSNDNHENYFSVTSLATKISVFDSAGFMLETKAPTPSVRRDKQIFPENSLAMIFISIIISYPNYLHKL